MASRARYSEPAAYPAQPRPLRFEHYINQSSHGGELTIIGLGASSWSGLGRDRGVEWHIFECMGSGWRMSRKKCRLASSYPRLSREGYVSVD
jgi:hypothetical protein